MFSIFYNGLLFLYLLCSFWKIFQKKYKGLFPKKLFLGKIFEKVPKDKKIIWAHAVSVGETKVLKNLLEELKKEDVFIIISSVTKTGHKEAKKLCGDLCVFMPFDFSFIWKKLFKNIQPYLVIISETDFWPNFLKFSKKTAKIILVNGKMSDRSFRFYGKFKKIGKKIFSLLDLLCVQNEEYLEKFATFVDRKKIVVSGNLKTSNFLKKLSNEKILQWKKIFNITTEDIITIASTHEREEELILKNIDTKKYKIFLAPRHPERFLKVEKFLKENNFSFKKLSEKKEISEENIILIDTMGFLNVCYQLSKISILGGSFVKIGGHNLLEPTFFDSYVLFGPYVFEQIDLKKILEKYDLGKSVEISSLNKEIEKILKRKKFAKEKEFLQELEKPLLKTLFFIKKELKKS